MAEKTVLSEKIKETSNKLERASKLTTGLADEQVCTSNIEKENQERKNRKDIRRPIQINMIRCVGKLQYSSWMPD